MPEGSSAGDTSRSSSDADPLISRASLLTMSPQVFAKALTTDPLAPSVSCASADTSAP